MSSAATPPSLRPSVFLSYASEDRAAARALRDALASAGIDVWYDESDLAGGDAWDQKIRRQIRECDYFMPVISATTERRKEGYFRREWRLATERTLDMADDVLFLLPVVIDETPEVGARVPEKFTTVQWLRAPGGVTTPALSALMQRLLAGEHTVAPRPPLVTRPPVESKRAAITAPLPLPPKPPPATETAGPPPMPPFPHAPEKGGIGQWLKFAAEVVWWVVTAAWLLFSRLPRWLRVLAAIWVAFALISTCGQNGSGSKSRDKSREPPAPNPELEKKIEAATGQVAEMIQKSVKDGGFSLDKLGEQIGRSLAKGGIDPSVAGKPLVIVPFASEAGDAGGGEFAGAVFSACRERLAEQRPGAFGTTQATIAGPTEETWMTFGRNNGIDYVLGARISGAENSRTLAVRLLRIRSSQTAWSETFPIDPAKATETGRAIAEKVLELTASP